MRTPTDRASLYRWWRAALKAKGQFASLRDARDHGVAAPQIPDRAQAGFYARKARRDGPWLAARIYMRQVVNAKTGELLEEEQMICEWNGRTMDAGTEDFGHYDWVWFCNRPITQAEYKFGVGHDRWRNNKPEEKEPTAKDVTDWLRSKPPAFRKRKAAK